MCATAIPALAHDLRLARAHSSADLPVLITLVVFLLATNDCAVLGLLALLALWRVLDEAAIVLVLFCGGGAFAGGSFRRHPGDDRCRAGPSTFDANQAEMGSERPR